VAALVGKEENYGLTLALSGGGVRGFAHLGALRAIRDAGLPIVGLSGSSAGAYAAAHYALGKPLEVNPLLNHVIDKNLADIFLENGNRLLRLARLQKRLFKALRSVSMDDAHKLREGLLDFYGDVRIEELPINLALSAADLHTGEVVVLREGPLVEALMASSAIPGVFPPVPWKGRLLVDGDVAEKIPVTAAQSISKGPVVGVDVSNPVRRHNPHNSYEVMLMAAEASIRRLKRLAQERCDYTISLVPQEPIETFDYTMANQVYQMGRARTQALIEDLRRLLERERARGLRLWLRKKTEGR